MSPNLEELRNKARLGLIEKLDQEFGPESAVVVPFNYPVVVLNKDNTSVVLGDHIYPLDIQIRIQDIPTVIALLQDEYQKYQFLGFAKAIGEGITSGLDARKNSVVKDSHVPRTEQEDRKEEHPSPA